MQSPNPSSAAPSLRIALRAVGDDACVVELVGELDLGTIPMLETRLMRMLQTREAVIMDLSRLSFIDSSGIALLIRADREAKDRGLLTVIADGSQVDRVLSLTGIDRVLPMFPDREDALATLAPQPAPRGRHEAA